MSDDRFVLSGSKFIIKDYDRQPAFSSFLPGLAGVKGIPVWSFYTNRGQAINSFGIHHKGNAMMEFNSANTAYENTPVRGFRTFVRLEGKFFEPFGGEERPAERRMEIEKNTVTILEENRGLRFTVQYAVLPRENIGALVRHVEIENLGEEREIELLDGMPQIIVYGISNGQYKEMSNLYKSWADIKNLDHLAPVYTMRASTDDSAEVSQIEGGYFYCTVLEGKLQPIFYDKNVIFDYDTAMLRPVNFLEKGLSGVREQEQYFVNKVPCAFAGIARKLEKGEKLSFTSYAGFASSIELLNRKTEDFCRSHYAEEKLAQARELADAFTKDVWTRTADPLFDQYVEQCYLDNFLRGGYPFIFGKGKDKKVIHLFSRKHGDPERDYNFFSIAGEYYSQGNGNYRDVCQNRRNDVFFRPEVEDFNIRQFYNLVQMDGYNPLEIRPSTFVLREESGVQAAKILKEFVPQGAEVLEKVLEKPFTPGQITTAIAARGLAVEGDEEVLVEKLLELSDQRQEAGFGEGYWCDHWDYNMDLVQNYLMIYPEKKEELLFGGEDYRYYNSIGIVRPRRDTYVLNKGKVRQYGSMEHCEEKLSLPGFDEKGTNWLQDASGREVVTNLFGKMMTLAVNKFALLDPEGLGIEMEGGKPGWNDAMNGLPGLFGSSMPETMELKRMVAFLLEAVTERTASGKASEAGEGLQEAASDEGVKLCEELADFMFAIDDALREAADGEASGTGSAQAASDGETSGIGASQAAASGSAASFRLWNRIATLREEFREKTKLCVSGRKVTVSYEELRRILEAYAGRLELAEQRALALGNGIMPTYFTYEAAEYEAVKNEDGTDRISPYGLPSVKVTAFRQEPLPFFLEGPARMLAGVTEGERAAAAEMCRKLKETDIYDKKLKMYKTSVSLEGLSMENGRLLAFTPGWLERESVFLHMEYKYFLGMLKAGLYDQFYEAIGDALIPYQDPAVYKRSILENSSFLASSANPDPAVHGQGFVGRLSGSTVEMLSMWLGMFVGKDGFVLREGRPALHLSPVLAGRMFDEAGEVSFLLCGSCPVTYHNPRKKNTYGPGGVKIARMVLHIEDGDVAVEGDLLEGDLALAVREGRAKALEAWLEDAGEQDGPSLTEASEKRSGEQDGLCLTEASEKRSGERDEASLTEASEKRSGTNPADVRTACRKTSGEKRFPGGKAICYSGYRRGQSPRTGVYPSKEEIAQDLKILVEKGFSHIRMYDPNEHARRVLQVIEEEKLPLDCMIGIDPIAEYNNPGCAWATMYSEEQLLANRKRNDGELDKLIELAGEYPDIIIAVSVGNENRPSWGSDLVEEERLVGWAKKLKAGVSQMVTYNEGAPEWPGIPRLAGEVDFISIHSYPLWNRVGLEEAMAFHQRDYGKVKELYPGKQVIFTECGWATQCNDSMDRTQVSEEKQAQYIEKLTKWTAEEGIPLFLFEAFDEPWKGSEKEDEPEKHWGLFREDRSPKPAVKHLEE